MFLISCINNEKKKREEIIREEKEQGSERRNFLLLMSVMDTLIHYKMMPYSSNGVGERKP